MKKDYFVFEGNFKQLRNSMPTISWVNDKRTEKEAIKRFNGKHLIGGMEIISDSDDRESIVDSFLGGDSVSFYDTDGNYVELFYGGKIRLYYATDLGRAFPSLKCWKEFFIHLRNRGLKEVE